MLNRPRDEKFRCLLSNSHQFGSVPPVYTGPLLERIQTGTLWKVTQTSTDSGSISVRIHQFQCKRKAYLCLFWYRSVWMHSSVNGVKIPSCDNVLSFSIWILGYIWLIVIYEFEELGKSRGVSRSLVVGGGV